MKLSAALKAVNEKQEGVGVGVICNNGFSHM
jgi:hypothetical protein